LDRCATASDGATVCGTAILGGALVQTGIQTSVAAVEESLFDVSAHPNPGTDEIFLNVKGDRPGLVYCTITQISGQIMQETKWDYPGDSQQITLSTGNLIPGVYFIEIKSENVKKVIRWVKL
jgi:hypothetical protein